MRHAFLALAALLALSLPSSVSAAGSISWGSAVNGLELGISAGPDAKIPSIDAQVYVKNVSASSVTINTQKTLASVLQSVLLQQNGTTVPSSAQFYGSHVKDLTVPANSTVRLIGAFYVSSTSSFSLPSGQYSVSDNGTVVLANGTSQPLSTGTVQVTL